MPDLESILLKGAAEWNDWRATNRTIWPDLTRINLSHMNLEGIDLSNANLPRAELEGASLRSANLRNANFKDALLIGIDAWGANFDEANLYNADLREADLRHASFRYANFRAKLDKARLDQAIFGHTGINRSLLLEARDLDTTLHDGASTIDLVMLEDVMRQLQNNPARFPTVARFLRASGVPQHILDYYSGRLGAQPSWQSCFLSYSFSDSSFASQAYEFLEKNKVPCFLAERETQLGARIETKMKAEILGRDRFILICSKESLESDWVQLELGYAQAKEERLDQEIVLPIDLDGFLFSPSYYGDTAELLRSRLAANFVGWRDHAFPLEKRFQSILSALRTS